MYFHINCLLVCFVEGLMCKCGPVGGWGETPVSHRDQWMRLGNVSGFIVQHNDYIIG